jgi:ABC-type lipoprotein export system ATPase subunit
MNKLTGKKITKVYSRGVKALDRVDVEIDKGDIAVVFGPSGSGKTTLLNILGLLDKPSEGSVFLDGQECAGLHEKKSASLRNRNFGFIFQFFYLIPELTALENIMLPLWIKEKTSLKKADYYQKAEKYLREFNLVHRKNFYPHSLSGGELQRVAICRSLICEPQVIFADEPTGSTDSVSSKLFFDILKYLNKEKKVTFLIVSHNEKFLQVATKVVYLKEGKVEKINKFI